jgi:hypothetical protein
MCDIQASDVQASNIQASNIQASPRPLAWTGDIQASTRGLSGQ